MDHAEEIFRGGRFGLNFPECELSEPVALVELAAGRGEEFYFFRGGKNRRHNLCSSF